MRLTGNQIDFLNYLGWYVNDNSIDNNEYSVSDAIDWIGKQYSLQSVVTIEGDKYVYKYFNGSYECWETSEELDSYEEAESKLLDKLIAILVTYI